MDIIFVNVIARTRKLEQRGASYDVFCIYVINLLERFKKHYPELVDIIKDLQCLVPSFHAHAHRDMCQVVYGFQYESRQTIYLIS